MGGRSFRGPRKLTTLFSALMVVSLCLISINAQALSSVEVSFDEMVAQSDQILVGTASQIDSYWGLGNAAGTIFTDIQLTDIDPIKGTFPTSDYTLKVIGGVIGDQAQFYPGLPSFETGQRYLLFIKGNNRSMFPITGVTQGFYRVQWDANRERQIAIPATGDNVTAMSRHARGMADQHNQQGADLDTLISEIRANMKQSD